MNSEEQLIVTGRVIDAARKIESRLVECGASGSGLREKAESLTPALPDEVTRLIHFIGTIRNRVAHESGTTLRQDELELFEEAARAVLDELDKRGTVSPAASEKVKTPELPPAVRPAPPSKADCASPIPAEPAPPAGKPREPEPARGEPLLPEWSSPLWAALPGLHLIYAFGALWRAFGAGQLYLLLLLAELGALTALGFAAALESLPLAVAGGTLFLAIYFCGIWLGLRNPPDAGGRFWLTLLPLANLLFFVRKIAAFIEPARLVVAIAILGIWLAAIQLAIYGEFPAAGIAAAASWLGALADSLLRR